MSIFSNYADQVLIFGILAISLNLLLGFAGQVSVAHAAFAAVGGYSVGYLALTHHWNLFFGVFVGTLVAGLFGVAVALPALRLSVEYLILLTLAVSSVLLGLFQTFPQLGGTYGLINIPKASLFGWTLASPRDWLLPLLVFLVLTFALCHRLGESPFGRVLRGLRDDPEAMRSLGKNVVAAKILVFGVTCALAGLGGGLLASFNSIATPSQFGFDVSLSIFAMVIFGGLGNLYGSVLGAATVVLTKPLLEWAVSLSPETAGLWRLTIYGLLLVVLMRLRPEGLLPEGVNPFRPATWRRASAIPGDAATDNPPAPVLRVAEESPAGDTSRWKSAPVVLDVKGLSKSFGGIVAASELDLELRRGTITALVGPNGAGKTTVFNLLTGFIRPDAGSIRLDGRELVGRTPNAVAGYGMVRSWQDVRIVPRLSCRANVMLGVQRQLGESVPRLFTSPGAVRDAEVATREAADKWLEFVGMSAFADVPGGALSFGQSKLVALARVLATEAPVLLLDEPASGIDTVWVDTMLSLIEQVRDQGRTVCIVEHNLHVVGRLADHTYFMELGRITDQGTLDHLTGSPRLAEAYFGVA
jgi:branched-chain amino acid transport system permease protein